MDSADLSNFSLPHSGSRLLSEPSLQISSSNSSRTGPGGDDLSLSELSLSQRPQQHGVTRRRPFSLLAQPSPSDESIADEDDDPDEDGLERTMTQEDVEKADRLATKTREEKLQHDLFILKKLNTAFEVYKDALRETKSSTQRVAAQLEHTNALLDKYMNILAKSEKVTKLILDERWEGADVDEDTVEREYQEALEKVRREEEERQLAAQRERERVEREERDREERRERERIERERAEASKTAGRGSGVRGVRGTRASMRGTRGIPRTAPTPATRTTRGTGTTIGSGGSATRRTVSSASTSGIGRSVSRRS